MMGEPRHFITEMFLIFLKEYLVPATVIAVCTVAPPVIIASAGFGASGVAAGSLAAGVQSSIGNVAAGSAFAVLRSAGTVPLVTAGIGAAAGAGGLAIGYGGAAASTVVKTVSAFSAAAFACF